MRISDWSSDVCSSDLRSFVNQDSQDRFDGNPQPSWRKPAGMLLILALIGGWTAIVVSLSSWVGAWPVLVQAIFYLVADRKSVVLGQSVSVRVVLGGRRFI